MKNIDLSKIFWSKCRAKLLEKFILDYDSWDKEWFHMRLLARDLDEQINSVKRELDNLSSLWILKYKSDLKKKIFFVNKNFSFLNEFIQIFLKNYDPFDKIKKYFLDKKDLELIIINEKIKRKLVTESKAILDIFLIWEIDRDDLNDFLASVFYNRKVKYAIISTPDFYDRLSYWDKLIKNILNEQWNLIIKDNLKVSEKFM